MIADTTVPTVWVIEGETVYEFASRRDAVAHVAAEYRKVADLRSMQPGQSYNLTMSDGTSKMVQVQSQSAEGVQVLDPNSGQTMMIPHVQPGAEPKPAQQGGTGGTTPKPNAQPQNQNASQPATPVSPENRTYTLSQNDLRITAAGLKLKRGPLKRPCPECGKKWCDCEPYEESGSRDEGREDFHSDGSRKQGSEFGKTPYYCKHDQGYLYPKNPNDREKYCATCGMVYVAKTGKVLRKATWEDIAKEEQKRIKEFELQQKKDKEKKQVDVQKAAFGPTPTTVGKFYFCPRCNTARTAIVDRDGQEVHRALAGGRVVRFLSCKHPSPIEDPPVQPSWQPRGAKTAGCDSDYWMEGDDCDCPAHKKEKRRKAFRAWKNRDKIVHAFDLIAQPAMPQNQAMPSGDVVNEGETINRDEKSPGEFAEEPESQPQTQDPNAKRKLTPHEIIEEAESLIRNALVKGVKIGAAELTEYMTTYYQNNPQELMQGIALAWQKVQYEEQMEGAGDPQAPGGEGFGPQAPTTPEEAAQMAPRNGPIRTKAL